MNNQIKNPADLEYPATYTEIMDKIKILLAEADKQLEIERPQVIKEIVKTMKFYKIKIHDLNFPYAVRPVSVTQVNVENRRTKIIELYQQNHRNPNEIAAMLNTTVYIINNDITWLRKHSFL